MGLAVVDEQHRFGVMQRARLLAKSSGWVPHFLVMTATPIPRTLALTLYGDLDISTIKERPPGRGKVITKWVYASKRPLVYKWLFEEAKAGRQAYVVAPVIERSDKLDVTAVEELYETLRRQAPVPVGMVHGRMSAEERRRVMDAFRRGQIKILVATTVIEVGVDVPQASRMVIEGAERFGLAQLHQLRGRISRSKETAYCVLITDYSLSDETKKRLRAFVSTEDGFKIAEYDLRLRGPGELAGTRQHGLPDFKVLDLMRDYKVIVSARNDVKRFLERARIEDYPELKRALERRQGELEVIVG
ncbi:hypothetical protein DRO33_06520 [Candidatus Bathyarchaeota archaeon]|nr:MAG: hypothetical protein DRO33_06520 [Candidatus Bathyarchaeota archaeon]